MLWWHRFAHHVNEIERHSSGVYAGIEMGRIESFAVCSCGATWRRIVYNALYGEHRWMRIR